MFEIKRLLVAFETAAAALEAETALLPNGDLTAVRAAAEAKSFALEALRTAIEADEAEIIDNVKAELAAAAQRLLIAGERNAEALRRTLAGTRHVLRCLTEAAATASMTGTYGPDGKPRASTQPLVTVARTA